jgi:hypothetical protein
MVFTLLQDLGEAGQGSSGEAVGIARRGDDRFLADVALADMLDRDPGFSGHRCRRLAHPLTQCRGKVRIVEDADLVGVEEPRHPLGVADSAEQTVGSVPVTTTRS